MNDCWDMVFYAFSQRVKCGGGLEGIPEWVLEISIVMNSIWNCILVFTLEFVLSQMQMLEDRV